MEIATNLKIILKDNGQTIGVQNMNSDSLIQAILDAASIRPMLNVCADEFEISNEDVDRVLNATEDSRGGIARSILYRLFHVVELYSEKDYFENDRGACGLEGLRYSFYFKTEKEAYDFTESFKIKTEEEQIFFLGLSDSINFELKEIRIVPKK